MYSLILGGLGFIGLTYILENKSKKIICIDNQSYAANLSKLKYLKKLLINKPLTSYEIIARKINTIELDK